jgi:hypothetical protein
LLIVFKGLGYSLSLGAFRGGPTFPAIFLGAAGGIMASHLPGFPMAAGVAVGIGTGTVAILRLPLSAVVVATLLTGSAGAGVTPLVIIGVVVAYLATLWLSSLKATRIADPPSVESGETGPADAASAPSSLSRA